MASHRIVCAPGQRSYAPGPGMYTPDRDGTHNLELAFYCVGAANISIPAGGEKPPIKEPPNDTNSSTTRELTQTEERANLEHPVKEIRDHTTKPHRSSPYKNS